VENLHLQLDIPWSGTSSQDTDTNLEMMNAAQRQSWYDDNTKQKTSVKGIKRKNVTLKMNESLPIDSRGQVNTAALDS